jgi:hypothetical protein
MVQKIATKAAFDSLNISDIQRIQAEMKSSTILQRERSVRGNSSGISGKILWNFVRCL